MLSARKPTLEEIVSTKRRIPGAAEEPQTIPYRAKYPKLSRDQIVMLEAAINERVPVGYSSPLPPDQWYKYSEIAAYRQGVDRVLNDLKSALED